MEKESYERIADRSRWYEILQSASEECAELIQACSKYERAHNIGLPTNTTPNEAIEMLTEEVAHVLNCCDMIIYKIGLDKQDIMREQIKGNQKILDRFEKDYERREY